MTQRRLFTRRERRAIYRRAGGRCEQCGATLNYTNYEADHIVPFARGGETSTDNGQALCRPCNRSKTDSMDIFNIKTLMQRVKLRLWQERMRAAWHKRVRQDKNVRDFLAGVATGAGKTMGAVAITADDMVAGRITHALVLTSSLSTIGKRSVGKKRGYGWLEAFQRVGIEAMEGDNTKLEFNVPSDVQVVVMHYASAASAPKNDAKSGARKIAKSGARNIADLWAGKSWMLILDEPQHLRASAPREDADEEEKQASAWGAAVEFLLKLCSASLLLTATPIRSDSERVPGMEYDAIEGSDDFAVRLHFGYPYKAAFDDGWVREGAFHCINADAEWIEEGELLTKAFDSKGISKKGRTKQMSLFLDPKSASFKLLLITLLENIQRQRESDLHQGLSVPQAAGMLVCRDRDHIKEVLKLYRADITRILGADAVVVTADDASARGKIEAFRDSTDPLLISIGMVAEGTDIPRLRSLGFATNKLTRLHFVQIVGRVMRVVFDADGTRSPAMQIADVFMPAHPWLIKYAEEFKNLHDKLRAKRDQDGPPPGEGKPLVGRSSTPTSTDAVIASLDGEPQIVSAAGIAYVRELLRKAGSNIDWTEMYKVLLASGMWPKTFNDQPTTRPADTGNSGDLEQLTHKELRSIYHKLVQATANVELPGAAPGDRYAITRDKYDRQFGIKGDDAREGANKTEWITAILHLQGVSDPMRGINKLKGAL